MSKEFFIDELDTEVLFAKGEKLRNTGEVTIYDLISAGDKNNLSPLEVAKIVSRQLYLYKNPGAYIFDGKRDWVGLINIFKKEEKLPFVVSHTSLTSINFALGENINPRPFVDNIVKYQPSQEELKGYSKSEIQRISKGPALLAGSAVLIHWDGVDENRIMLRERAGGKYKGLLAIPGGHADSPIDTFALFEVIEETGLEENIVRTARPLGVADQLIFVQKNNNPESRLTRYLNFIWEIDISFSKVLDKAEENGWHMYDDDEIPIDNLTPITKLAIELSGFPMWTSDKKQ